MNASPKIDIYVGYSNLGRWQATIYGWNDRIVASEMQCEFHEAMIINNLLRDFNGHSVRCLQNLVGANSDQQPRPGSGLASDATMARCALTLVVVESEHLFAKQGERAQERPHILFSDLS